MGWRRDPRDSVPATGPVVSERVRMTLSRLMPRPDFVMPQMIRCRAETSPEAHLIEPVDGCPITIGEFHVSSVRLAHALERVGIKPCDCVASMLEASPLAVEVWMAAAWLRAYEVPVNPDYRGASLLHTLNDSAARVLITRDTLLPRVEAIAGSLPHLEAVVVTGTAACAPEGFPSRIVVVGYEEFVDHDDLSEFPGPRHSDAYALNYTSGTTGPSKGVLRGWAGLHASLQTVFPDDVEDYDDPAVYSPWAMFHSSGKISALAAVQSGARLVQRSGFSLSEFWQDISKSRCTHAALFSVGARLWEARSARWATNPLRRAFVIPLFPGFDEFARFFDVRVASAWGMTEIGQPLSAPAPRDWRSCGTVVPGYEVRLVDEFDEEVPRGEPGQLIVRHDRPWHIATRYLGRPDATAAAWQNGWFHTGDVLREDEDGNFFFVDRMKDYIRQRGHNVSSLEVEQEVLAHPDVTECACVGVRQQLSDASPTVVGDEEIKIFAVLRAGAVGDEAALSEFLQDRLPRQMLPRFIEFVTDLPRTPTMKVRKVELRERGNSMQTWDRLGRFDGVAGGEVPRAEADELAKQ